MLIINLSSGYPRDLFWHLKNFNDIFLKSKMQILRRGLSGFFKRRYKKGWMQARLQENINQRCSTQNNPTWSFDSRKKK